MKIELRGNALAGAAEQIVVGATFLIFYGVAIREAGAEVVGVLSLVLVLASLGTMANVGFGGAIARFAPMYEGRGDRLSTVLCVETAILCTVSLYGALLAAVYIPFQAFIVSQTGPAHAALVRDLMPPAVAYVFAMGVGSVTTGALTTLQRSDLRFGANAVGAAVCLAFVILATPKYGVVAAMWGLAAQAAVVLVLTWFFLRKALPELGWAPYRFNRSLAVELVRLGFNLQLQSLLLVALEPVSRLLLGQFGSLAQVTYFSMSSRFVIQVRAILFAAAQPVLSAFSYLRESNPAALDELYVRACAMIGLVAVLALSATAAAAPFIGEVWIGSRQEVFVTFVAIQTVGWLAVTVVLGSYFNAYSLGYMRYNLGGHVAMAATNLTLGPLLGWLLGPVGVVAALTLSLVVAGTIMGVGNARLNARHKSYDFRAEAPLLISAAIGVALAVAGYGWLRTQFPPIVAGLGSGLVWLCVVAPAAVMHPAGSLLISAVRAGRPPSIIPPVG